MDRPLVTQPIDDLAGNDDKGRSPEESIARSVIPWPLDDNKSRYLGLRASTFTRREAIKMLGVANSTVSYWRELYPEFVEIDDNIGKYQAELADKYISLEFIRNFRLFTEKDFRVVKKSLLEGEELEKAGGWSKYDQEYLLKARAQYSPQMIQTIKEIVTGEKSDGFDFARSLAELAKSGEGRLAMEWKGNGKNQQ